MRPNNLKIYKGFLTLWLILLVIALGVAALIAFGILDVGKFKKNTSFSGKPATQVEDQQVENLQKQSSSDEVVDIEKDLNTTNLNSLDQELPDVDRAVGEL